jgi:hypothetical protein
MERADALAGAAAARADRDGGVLPTVAGARDAPIPGATAGRGVKSTARPRVNDTGGDAVRRDGMIDR